MLTPANMVTGRLVSGLAGVIFARPLFRLLEVTENPKRASLIGAVVFVLDAGSAAAVLAAVAGRKSDRLRQAALMNGIADLLGGVALSALAIQRRRIARLTASGFAASLFAAGTAWLVMSGKSYGDPVDE